MAKAKTDLIKLVIVEFALKGHGTYSLAISLAATLVIVFAMVRGHRASTNII